MYNRTNLTLSARTLSNRLNLGTRSLAPTASVNHGDQALRIRHSYHDVMREGMVWCDVFPTIGTRYGIPTIPVSLSLLQQCQPSCRIGQPGQSAVDVRVEPEPRPADLVDRPERRVKDGDPRFPSVAVAPVERERRTAKRAIGSTSRLGGKSPGKPFLKRAARRAAKHAAASAANLGK
jgi:hypothetical protein